MDVMKEDSQISPQSYRPGYPLFLIDTQMWQSQYYPD